MARKSKKSLKKQRRTKKRSLGGNPTRPISELFAIVGKAVTIARRRRMYDNEPETITQEIIDLLRKNTYDVNEIYANTTLLSEVCRYGYYTVIAELMHPRYMVDVNLPANDAPIINLLETDMDNSVIVLQAFEALTSNNNVNMNVRKLRTNETPLHLAFMWPTSVIQKILDLGGDPGDFNNIYNSTPLIYATKHQCDEDIIQLIIDTDRCNPYHRDNEGKTALLHACYRIDTVLMLLEKYPRLLTMTDNDNRDVSYYVKNAYDNSVGVSSLEMRKKYRRLLKMLKPENVMFLNNDVSNAFQTDVKNYDIMNVYMGENAFNKK